MATAPAPERAVRTAQAKPVAKPAVTRPKTGGPMPVGPGVTPRPRTATPRPGAVVDPARPGTGGPMPPAPGVRGARPPRPVNPRLSRGMSDAIPPPTNTVGGTPQAPQMQPAGPPRAKPAYDTRAGAAAAGVTPQQRATLPVKRASVGGMGPASGILPAPAMTGLTTPAMGAPNAAINPTGQLGGGVPPLMMKHGGLVPSRSEYEGYAKPRNSSTSTKATVAPEPMAVAKRVLHGIKTGTPALTVKPGLALTGKGHGKGFARRAEEARIVNKRLPKAQAVLDAIPETDTDT